MGPVSVRRAYYNQGVFFPHLPYILPTFLTPRVFSLEFIRHNLIVENEHFISFKKEFEITLPQVVGPFIIKNKYALPAVEALLQEMTFKKATKINCDPHHIGSQRRKLKKKNEFEHRVVEGLNENTNWMENQKQMKDANDLQENPLAIMKSIVVIIPTPSRLEMAGERTHSEAIETEQEENSETSKGQRTGSEGELVKVTEVENTKK